MPLRGSRNARVAASVIFAWIIFSVASNWTQIQSLYCKNYLEKETDEVICRAMRCRYPHYFFVPFSEFWEDEDIGYQPRSWCIESAIDALNR